MPENKDIERGKPDDIERRRDSLVQRSLDYLKEFEEQGLANVEEPDLEGWDLHRAAKENRVDIARVLIARGHDVERWDWLYMSPLHWAAWKNSLDVARLLIDHHARIESLAGSEGWRSGYGTPLYFAVRHKSLDVARLLIDRGANTDDLSLMKKDELDEEWSSWKPSIGSDYSIEDQKLDFPKLLNACVLDDHESVTGILEAGFILDELPIVVEKNGGWALIPEMFVDQTRFNHWSGWMSDPEWDEWLEWVEWHYWSEQGFNRYGSSVVPSGLEGEDPPHILNWLWVCTLYDSPKALSEFIDHIAENELGRAGIDNWSDWDSFKKKNLEDQDWSLQNPYIDLIDPMFSDVEEKETCSDYASRTGKLGVVSVFREYGL